MNFTIKIAMKVVTSLSVYEKYWSIFSVVMKVVYYDRNGMLCSTKIICEKLNLVLQ